jgi:hypothetical protein
VPHFHPRVGLLLSIRVLAVPAAAPVSVRLSPERALLTPVSYRLPVLNIPVAAPILAEALSSATAIVVEAAFFLRKSIKVTRVNANNRIHAFIIDKTTQHCGTLEQQ